MISLSNKKNKFRRPAALLFLFIFSLTTNTVTLAETTRTVTPSSDVLMQSDINGNLIPVPGLFGDTTTLNNNDTVLKPFTQQDTATGSAECRISPKEGTYNYCMLAPLNGLLGETPGENGVMKIDGLKVFFSRVYIFGIMIAVGLAVLMITLGGIQTATTDSIMGKASGKDKINAAIAGLLVALFSYVILNTINPAILDLGKLDTTIQATSTK